MLLGQITIGGSFSGQPENGGSTTTHTFGPNTFNNPNSPAQTGFVALAEGDNIIAIPANTLFVYVLMLANNTVQVYASKGSGIAGTDIALTGFVAFTPLAG